MSLLLYACLALGAAVVIGLLARNSTSATHSRTYTIHLESPVWQRKSRRCLQSTRYRCALLPWMRAINAHHLHYGNIEREWLIRDLVPLSWLGHRIAHAWIFWKGPLRPFMLWWLRLSTLTIAIAVRWWLALPVLALLVWAAFRIAHGLHR